MSDSKELLSDSKELVSDSKWELLEDGSRILDHNIQLVSRTGSNHDNKLDVCSDGVVFGMDDKCLHNVNAQDTSHHYNKDHNGTYDHHLQLYLRKKYINSVIWIFRYKGSFR